MSTSAKIIVILLVLAFVVSVAGGVLVLGIYTADTAQKPAAAKAAAASPVKALPSSAGEGIARIKARNELVVAMDTGTPPWAGSPPTYFLNPKGEPDGFDYVVARHIADAVGVSKIRLVHVGYDDLSGALQADPDLDLFIAGYTPDGSEGIGFSDPYLEYGLCLVVPTRSKIQTTSDLWGKKIAIYPDDAAEAQVARLVKGYTELVRLADGYWDLLLNGKIDAYLYDLPYAVAEIEVFYKQNPHHRGALRIAQYNLTDSTYSVGVREGDPELLKVTNEAIAAFRASPDYAIALKTYLAGAPTVDAAEPTGAEGERHVVAAGETLSTIAATRLGSAGRWKDIWDLNKSRIGNPNLVEVGDELLLP